MPVSRLIWGSVSSKLASDVQSTSGRRATLKSTTAVSYALDIARELVRLDAVC